MPALFSSMTSWKRSSSFVCSPKAPNASGTGHSGSRIERAWLTFVSQWPASSSMPQIVILNGAMVFTGGAPEEWSIVGHFASIM